LRALVTVRVSLLNAWGVADTVNLYPIDAGIEGTPLVNPNVIDGGIEEVGTVGINEKDIDIIYWKYIISQRAKRSAKQLEK